MNSDIPIQIAETIQTAHIKRDPSPSHDINPSTAASKREPASLRTQTSHSQHHDSLIPDDGIDEDDDEEDYAQSETETDEASEYNVVKSRPRRNIHHLPPIPDLRYEQSYLHSHDAPSSRSPLQYPSLRLAVLEPKRPDSRLLDRSPGAALVNFGGGGGYGGREGRKVVEAFSQNFQRELGGGYA
ncbi:hypothetical protein NEUTE1DRAFT_122412 [Neurospora tetrasperma FGSC 2508]|uniref:DUF1770-domain-containing protein n=1 Tax=Neurospora tetrasperma (strain FGSC 2508 / ATCC MYA-4615 / P0657) TaxID=510951 RepID=F8MJT4_NEUT8|nr:uncharacterized protein NEUTE1DRAFT_122412 [Neurospora tetrasperma FGSC 2508]EGO58121.1 hypothetical protein NEUTE1DRAFT_122412 [Neurospora tetrasperma FGSC 2508]EGZ71570.1 DUF1770-domain-containing protein [Neurospora tetrasperma FGSC 2509]